MNSEIANILIISDKDLLGLTWCGVCPFSWLLYVIYTKWEKGEHQNPLEHSGKT